MSENRDSICVVIVTVDAAAKVLPDLVPHAQKGLSLFATFGGFISGTLHINPEGTRMVQYLQWETEAHHLACMNDPRWEEMDSARTFMETIHAGRATMDVNTYRIVDCRRADA